MTATSRLTRGFSQEHLILEPFGGGGEHLRAVGPDAAGVSLAMDRRDALPVDHAA